jgi:hypothetical protein
MSDQERYIFNASELLADLFSIEEWRAFALKHYPNLIKHLPLTAESLCDYFNKVTHLLCRHGLIDVILCDNLDLERPRRREDIERLRESLGDDDRTSQSELIFDCTEADLTVENLAKILSILRSTTGNRSRLIINVNRNRIIVDGLRIEIGMRMMRDLQARIEQDLGFELYDIVTPARTRPRQEIPAVFTESEKSDAQERWMSKFSMLRIRSWHSDELEPVPYSLDGEDHGPSPSTVDIIGLIERFFTPEQLLFFIHNKIVGEMDESLFGHSQATPDAFLNSLERTLHRPPTIKDIFHLLQESRLEIIALRIMSTSFSAYADEISQNLEAYEEENPPRDSFLPPPRSRRS